MSESRHKALRRAARLAKPAPKRSWYRRFIDCCRGAYYEVRYR